VLLKDPGKKLQGSGKVIRRMEIHNDDEIDQDCICNFLQQAISKQMEMPMFYPNNNH